MLLLTIKPSWFSFSSNQEKFSLRPFSSELKGESLGEEF
jgi:hypothetical protein